MRRAVGCWLCVLSCTFGIICLAEVARIQAKAWLAQSLLEHAWQQSIDTQQAVKAWPWADSWPVAALQLPTEQSPLIVLSGDDGASLAFGPGLHRATHLPEENEITLISAHNDTHFASLKTFEPGDELTLTTLQGTHVYRVRELVIADQNALGDLAASGMHSNAVPMLLLSTCYPFDALGANTAQRFIVIAQKV
ncbi:MAG: class GN sortase [Oleiphilaceae bacterium]|nr:class GN sortase [Oleiphilaceae bacterium]